MTILSPDGILAGFQQPVSFAKVVTPTMVAGRPQSLWYLNGFPGAGVANGTLNGATYSSTSSVPTGAIYHTDPGAGLGSYLAKFIAWGSVTSPGVLWLCDRLWDNQPAVNSNAAQSIVSPTWPARDQNGATSGVGVQLGVELSVAASSTAAVISVSYTNSAGTAGQTATFLDLPTVAASQIGYFYRLQLAKGDVGVQSVQSATFSTAWTTGTIHLVAYRPLSFSLLQAVAIGNAVDALSSGLPQLYNGITPFCVYHPETTTALILSALYQETQG